jgi:parvulin-like peptidyl-prolyl isomerase
MDQMYLRNALRLFIALLAVGLIPQFAVAQAPNTPSSPSNTTAAPANPAANPAGPTMQTPESPDKVVLKVGTQQFTKADIDNFIAHLDPRTQSALAARGKRYLGDQYALVVLLSQRAQAHHLDERPDFIQQLAYQQQQIKQQMLAKAAFDEISEEAKVGPDDIQKFYDAHTTDFDQITVRQILVRVKPPAPANAQPTPATLNVSGLSAADAKVRAEAIRKELLAGTDITKVINDFKAPGDVIIEPETRTLRRAQMRPDLAKTAFDLKDGEVSEPIDITQGLIMLQVTAHGHVDLKTATPDIERMLRPEKVDAAMAEAKKSTPIWMDDQYFPPAQSPQGHPSLMAPGTPATPRQ